jgi:hypothetical protein
MLKVKRLPKILVFRCRADLAEQLVGTAKEKGTSVSGLIRQLLMAGLAVQTLL